MTENRSVVVWEWGQDRETAGRTMEAQRHLRVRNMFIFLVVMVSDIHMSKLFRLYTLSVYENKLLSVNYTSVRLV